MGADHWSDVFTTADADGTIRIYLDRNPLAFDDLLEYIEYGKMFLSNLIASDDNGARLERLRAECDYFTVSAIMKDIDDLKFGEAVSFRADGWFSVQAQFVRDREGDIVNWVWGKTFENESIATREGRGRNLSICCVNTTGTYHLLLYSLYSIAVRALPPGHSYLSEGTDEFVRVSVFHDKMAENDGGHWTYPLARHGAFDYRDQTQEDQDSLLFTAAFAELVSLKKGNQLYFEHGHAPYLPSGYTRAHDYLVDCSAFAEEEPHCVNFATLVRVDGGISKWIAKGDNDMRSEPSQVKWVAAQNDFPKTNLATRLDEHDETKIHFRKAGFYLLLGRIAAKLKRKFKPVWLEPCGPTIRLELYSKGGLPLQIDSEVVSFWSINFWEEYSYNNNMTEYGPINDVIYAERGSYISVRASPGACFAAHGTALSVPGSTLKHDKIPTQSLSAIRLDNMRLDRYRVSHCSGEISYCRALGGGGAEPEQAPLFVVERRTENSRTQGLLKALEDFQCIVIGCISSKFGDIVSLHKNNDAIVHSQLCEGIGHGYGSHTLNTVMEFKANDTFNVVLSRGRSHDVNSGGHLAFLVLQ